MSPAGLDAPEPVCYYSGDEEIGAEDEAKLFRQL
jgi:hypothetical protein